MKFSPITAISLIAILRATEAYGILPPNPAIPSENPGGNPGGIPGGLPAGQSGGVPPGGISMGLLPLEIAPNQTSEDIGTNQTGELEPDLNTEGLGSPERISPEQLTEQQDYGKFGPGNVPPTKQPAYQDETGQGSGESRSRGVPPV